MGKWGNGEMGRWGDYRRARFETLKPLKPLKMGKLENWKIDPS
jgi:hypothetical protein